MATHWIHVGVIRIRSCYTILSVKSVHSFNLLLVISLNIYAFTLLLKIMVVFNFLISEPDIYIVLYSGVKSVFVTTKLANMEKIRPARNAT